MYEAPRFLGSGDSCLFVEFSESVDMAANMKLQALRRALEKKNVTGVREYVATYRSLSIQFNPLVTSRQRIEAAVVDTLGKLEMGEHAARRVVVLPVAYGGEFGPDMESVSSHTGLDEDEIVRRHTGTDCYCYMLGFAPGFTYLGGMDETLSTPRLKTPRLQTPPGSIGIAGKQTGAYSIPSPGGWQIIGRTPLKLFNPQDAQNPTLVDAGDWVRFRSITTGEYEDILQSVQAGRYRPERIVEEGGV